MGEWKHVKLGDVCIIERGGSPRPINNFITNDEDGINWIKIGDTSSDSMYITSTKEKIKPEGMKKSRYVKSGDFLLTNSMSFGRPYILKIDGCIHDGWLLIRDDKGTFDKRFLYYLLSSEYIYTRFTNMAVGGVVNNLNSEMVRNLELDIPPLQIQTKIADMLDKAQTLVNKRKEQIKECEELIKSQFIEMFGDIPNNTKGWETKQLSEICELKSGGTPSRQNPEYFTGDIPWITTVALGKVSIDKEDAIEYITEEAVAKSATKLIPAKSILFGTRVGVGKTSINKVPMCTNQDIVAIVGVDGNKYNQVFMKKVIDSYSEYFNQQKRGATIQGIKSETLKSIAIPTVSIQLQNQFAQFVQQVDKLKFVMEKSLVELENNFNSLMQRAFKGELF